MFRNMITPEHIKAARAWLGWSQQRLAQVSKVGVVAINRFERGHSVLIPANQTALARALADAGIEFRPSGIEYKQEEGSNETWTGTV
jgi:ribosome-binding protein aMBF1 (putative translation factor)